MRIAEILDVIKQLAMSQGFYGRLYRSIEELAENDPDTYDEFVAELENQNFKDSLDVVFYFEC